MRKKCAFIYGNQIPFSNLLADMCKPVSLFSASAEKPENAIHLYYFKS